MRVLPLKQSGTIYTSNVYLILGDWNRLEDISGLIDVGRDPAIILDLENTNTGVGKRKLDRVVLTHSHYDHTELLPVIRERFRPQVCALTGTTAAVDCILQDGDEVRLGDQLFKVIAVPGHTADSLALYHRRSGSLFCGDATLLIASAGGSYEEGFVQALEQLCQLDIQIIYPGHGGPVKEHCNARLRASLDLVLADTKIHTRSDSNYEMVRQFENRR